MKRKSWPKSKILDLLNDLVEKNKTFSTLILYITDETVNEMHSNLTQNHIKVACIYRDTKQSDLEDVPNQIAENQVHFWLQPTQQLKTSIYITSSMWSVMITLTGRMIACTELEELPGLIKNRVHLFHPEEFKTVRKVATIFRRIKSCSAYNVELLCQFCGTEVTFDVKYMCKRKKTRGAQ